MQDLSTPDQSSTEAGNKTEKETIILARLRLRAPVIEHEINRIVGWLNDPWITKYSEQRHQEHTRQSQYKYIEQHKKYYRAICLGEAIIGTINAEVDEYNNIANVGILINHHYWGKGFGIEAWQGYCDYLFESGIHKIEAGCADLNHKMIKIFRSYGMEYEGNRKSHFKIMNQRCDLVQYGKISMWQNK